MTPIGAVHFVSSLVAIVAGAVVLLLPKGTRWHRTWGHAYVWSMALVVGTAFSLYNLTGSWTPFHLAAVVSGLTVAIGLWTVLRRTPRKQWIEVHAWWMAGSYLGLMAAFTAESLTRFVMPRLEGTLEGTAAWSAFWVVVAIGSFAGGGLGWWIMKTRMPGAIAATPDAIRRERAELRSLEE